MARDPQAFAALAVDPELGVLCWPNGADIDAELLRYDDLWNATVDHGGGYPASS